MILENFFVVRFFKIVFLLFVGVYSWTPYFLLTKALFVDVLLPFEAIFFIGVSLVSFCWIGKLGLEMLKR